MKLNDKYLWIKTMRKIVVIEEDEKLSEMLKRNLEKKGYDVLIASNGREGIEFFKDRLPYCVITDIHVQIRNGLDVILEVRKNFKNIPVIAIYNENKKNSPDLLSTAKRFGARATFYMPSELNKLINEIRSI